MTAHTVVSRLGTTDKESVVPAIPGSQITEVNFVDGYDRLDFGLGQALDQFNGLGLTPCERAIDLALLAATVTAADTRISRELASQTRGRARSKSVCLFRSRNSGATRSRYCAQPWSSSPETSGGCSFARALWTRRSCRLRRETFELPIQIVYACSPVDWTAL